MNTIDMRPIKKALREVPTSEEHYRALCVAFADRVHDDLVPRGVVLGLAMLQVDIAAGKVPPVSGLPDMVVSMMYMNLDDLIQQHVTPEQWAEIEVVRSQVVARATASPVTTSPGSGQTP